jgi:hypothetical protein
VTLPWEECAEKRGIWVIGKIVFLRGENGRFSRVTKAAWILGEMRVFFKKAVF